MNELASSAPPPTVADRAEPGWFFPLAATLWVTALWLVCRPFRGIRHDSILYVGQAFNSLWPGKLSSDWFFLTTSQDRFTVFSPLVSRAVQAVGLQTAEIGLLLLFNAFFLWAAWLLLRDLPALMRWGALVALAALSHTYGGEGSFAFAEPFLDARTLAEPFGLLALALLLRGQLAAGLVALAASFACHPLVAVPVALVGWTYLLLGDRRWLWGFLGLAAVPLLAWLDVGPFGAILRAYDPAWYHEVRTVDTQCFLLDWSVADWSAVLVDVALVLLGGRLLRATPLGRLIRATLIAGLVLTGVWVLGADVGHNILLTQLQFWRVYWILHVLALCLLPLLLAHHAAAPGTGRLLASAIVLATVAVESNWDTGWVGCVWLAIAVVVVARGVKLSPVIVRAGTLGALAASVLIMAIVYSHTREAVALSGSFGQTFGLSIVFSLLLVAASVGLGVLLALQRAQGLAVRTALGAAVLAILCFGALAWDQRSPWQTYTERAYASDGRPFQGLIPEGASVFWDGEPLQTWLLLHRPSFFSLNQASGLVFSREASMEFARRNRPFKQLMAQQRRCGELKALKSVGLLHGEIDCRPTVDVMEHICKLPNGGPDYLIFDWQRPEGLVASWRFEQGPPASRKTYYLYDCAKLR